MTTSAPTRPACGPSEPRPCVEELSVDSQALIEEARRRQQRRRLFTTLAIGLILAIATGGYFAAYGGGGHATVQHPHPPVSGAASHPAPIRVILTAQNHRPRATNNPSVHWGYCVRVRTAAGKPLGAPIRLNLRILMGRIAVAGVGQVWLRKGYDNWCAGIGGETNALLAVPRGKRLNFQAVVTSMGATVRRNWPIVVQ